MNLNLDYSKLHFKLINVTGYVLQFSHSLDLLLELKFVIFISRLDKDSMLEFNLEIQTYYNTNTGESYISNKFDYFGSLTIETVG